MHPNPKQIHLDLMMESMFAAYDGAEVDDWKVFCGTFQRYHGRYLHNFLRRALRVEVGVSADEVSLSTRAAVRFFWLTRGLVDLFEQSEEEGLLYRNVGADGSIHPVPMASSLLTRITAIVRMCDPAVVSRVCENLHAFEMGKLTFGALGNLAFYQDPAFRKTYVYACR